MIYSWLNIVPKPTKRQDNGAKLEPNATEIVKPGYYAQYVVS